MSGPWEKYKNNATVETGPWSKYQEQQSDTPMGDVALQAAKSAVTAPYDATKAMLDNPDEVRKQAPAAGAILAGPFAPVGAGLGQIASRMAGIAYGTEPPADNVNFSPKEAIAPVIQTVVAGLPETPAGQVVTNTLKKGYGKAAETLSGLKRDITQTVFKKGIGAYNAPSLPKAQQIFGEALGPEGRAALAEQGKAANAFDSELSNARAKAIEIGTKIENGETVTAIDALEARQATDRVISSTSWKDKKARELLFGWRNLFDNELAGQSGGKLADASRTYRSAIVKDKITTPTRMNKSGEASAFLPMILGSGPLGIGYATGNTKRGAQATAMGLAASSPMVWGAGAAALGTINPQVRQAILAELISRMANKKAQK